MSQEKTEKKKITSTTTEKPFEPFSSDEGVSPTEPTTPTKSKKGRGPAIPKDPKTGEPLLSKEELDQRNLRLQMRTISPKAIKTLSRILDEDDPLHKEATPAQLITAAKEVLDRAFDRSATGEPDTTGKVHDQIIIDRSVMPTNEN